MILYHGSFSFARDFISGTISYSQLSEAMKLGELGEQVVLISEKAFENISYISNSPADARIVVKIAEALECNPMDLIEI